MEVNLQLFLISLIIFFSFTIGTISGFGTVIIALSLGWSLMQVDILLPVLISLDFMLNIYIILRYHKMIKFPIVFRKILPFMGIGLILGSIISNYLSLNSLKKVFAVFVIYISLRELLKIYFRRVDSNETNIYKTNSLLISGGLIHGIFACGGPVLVYILSKFNLDKITFRSTISSVWLLLNSLLLGLLFFKGNYVAETARTVLFCLPAMLTGIILGEHLISKINEQKFRTLLFSLLFVSGSIFLAG